MRRSRSSLVAAVGLLSAVSSACAPTTTAGPAPEPDAMPSAPDGRIVQAGAPGEATRVFDGASMASVRGVEYTEADVAFMRGMIHHHAQALEMTALIEDRTETESIRRMGLRMEISQADEIGLMERWLEERSEAVPEWRAPATGHEGTEHGAMGHEAQASDHRMPGMLTPGQMASLEAARGATFDRLFLELMIQHHEGALTMVRDLYNTPGAAQESTVYKFASEVDADQDIEIRRMRQILQTLR